MRKVMAALAVALAVCGVLVGVQSSASATTCPPVGSCFGGKVYHASDGGYDAAIVVICNWGDAFNPDGSEKSRAEQSRHFRYVEEGTWSTADCGIDTDVIFVRSNEEIWCEVGPQPGYYAKVYDAIGPHKIHDLFKSKCLVHRD